MTDTDNGYEPIVPFVFQERLVIFLMPVQMFLIIPYLMRFSKRRNDELFDPLKRSYSIFSSILYKCMILCCLMIMIDGLFTWLP